MCVIRNSCGDTIRFFKTDNGFLWSITNQQGVCIAQSEKAFNSLEACKSHLKYIVAAVSVAAVNNFQP